MDMCNRECEYAFSGTRRNILHQKIILAFTDEDITRNSYLILTVGKANSELE